MQGLTTARRRHRWEGEPMGDEIAISRQTLTQRVYGWLRNEILTGRLNQGDRIVEPAIAEQLGVSATPVREALRLLAGDGLVVTDGWKGARVVELTQEEIRQCFEVRRGLEALVLREAMPRLTKQDTDALLALAHDTVKAKSQPAEELFHLDRRFHRFLLDKAGNKWLSAFLDTLGDVLTVARLPLFRVADVEQTTREHVGIAEAIQRGDLPLAERLLDAHIERVRDNSVLVRSEAKSKA